MRVFEFLKDDVTPIKAAGNSSFEVNTLEMFYFYNHLDETLQYNEPKIDAYSVGRSVIF
ncbi:hypothetical protein [Jeotgalibacillus haloalkalitolerans]|uniref:Uncharacterized protein n=1 Tax=Jeotgalibacillus haloalkalitolerans TaxID=3104292 RepID=A0ABU5KJH4_9BACL|nr:hypothetical protein [Jeotgalibacillus sp. HH7-29]MDZ5711409.1 hypothetical protein [Jeotgalibacillus sp. HH7-29]